MDNQYGSIDLTAQLPDVCLFVIFDNVPVIDLLQVDQVCSRWAALKTAACNRRRDLTILVGPNATQLVEKSRFAGNDAIVSPISSISFYWLNQENADILRERFVNIVNLQFVINNLPGKALLKACDLLSHYAVNLQSLIVRLSFARVGSVSHQEWSTETVSYTHRLLNILPSMCHLRKLTLEINSKVNRSFNLPILGQLEQFAFYSDDDNTVFLLDLLRSYVPSNQFPQRISILNPITKDTFTDFLRLSNPGKFTALCLKLPGFDLAPQVQALASFTERFTSLTSLELISGMVGLLELSHSLAGLFQLTHLKLFSGPAKWTENNTSSFDLYPLPSISSLSLDIWLTSHRDMYFAHFGTVFPSVKWLRIRPHYYNSSRNKRLNACPVCFGSLSTREEFQRCIQLLVQPWLDQCTTLKSLLTYSTDDNIEPIEWIHSDLEEP